MTIDKNSQENRWSIVTGSTGGIGTEITRILASKGQDLILVNRSENKAAIQSERLLREHHDLKIETLNADFLDTRSILDTISTISGIPGRIDALFNVAGVLNSSKILSAQGFESNFAVNTIAPYQLILGLKEKMVRPKMDRPAVILNLSSSAVTKQRKLNVMNLAHPRTVTGLMGTYAQSKLALTALTAAIADDLRSGNILVRAVDPGATKTAMTTQNASMPFILRLLAPLVFGDAKNQAAKIVRSADPLEYGGRTGIFVSDGKERALPSSASDAESQRQLLSLLNHII